MNLGEFKKMTEGLPDRTPICYHSYYKGCSHTTFSNSEVYVDTENKAIVMNPSGDYDDRKPK